VPKQLSKYPDEGHAGKSLATTPPTLPKSAEIVRHIIRYRFFTPVN
jgi:hypothetical protein